MAFISIIIPVYNAQEYLAGCLESVLGQTFTDWEVIVVDDGSTDDSPAICDRYAAQDQRILVIHQANARTSGAERRCRRRDRRVRDLHRQRRLVANR